MTSLPPPSGYARRFETPVETRLISPASATGGSAKLPQMDPRRRQLCFFGLSASLLGSGCSHVPMVQQTYDNLASIGKNGDPDRYPMTAEQIQQLPYATLGTRFHGGAKAVMVLATVDADVLQWVAANHIVLETQDGTLFRTEGLDRNLVATRWLLPNPLTRLGAGEQLDRAVYRSVDIASASMSTATCTSIRAGRRRMRKPSRSWTNPCACCASKNMCACPPGAGPRSTATGLVWRIDRSGARAAVHAGVAAAGAGVAEGLQLIRRMDFSALRLASLRFINS